MSDRLKDLIRIDILKQILDKFYKIIFSEMLKKNTITMGKDK